MDKNKIIEAAAKLVAKGAYDKAIKEYQRVLEVDPKDVRILQKMGELYQKKNDNAQAAQYFTRVAESYTNDGFFLKAVALYKQVLKLDGSLMDVNVKLAELHQQLQLMGEAMYYYQLVANHYDKQGDTRRSLEVLRKMVDLDPDNIPSRGKLADLYVREGMNDEAVAELTRAVEHHKRAGKLDDYARAAERLLSLRPDNLQLAKELAEVYLQKNDQKRALAKLQVCFKADNRDIETLRLLAIAFQGLGQMSKTISVFKELARAYEDKNFRDEAEQVWVQVGQLFPNDPDLAARNGSMDAAPAAPGPAPRGSNNATSMMPSYAGGPQPQATVAVPAHAPAPPGATTVAGAHTPRGQPKPAENSLGKLLTETDVYVKYGLHDKALEHLRKVFAIDPENIDAHEKAYAIYVASNNHAQSFEQLLNVLRLHTRSGDAPRAQPYLAAILQQDPGHAEVPVFLAALRMAGATVAQPAQPTGEPEAEDAILVDSSDDEVIVADEPEEVISAEMSVEEAPLEAEAEFIDEPLQSDEVMLSAADAEVAESVEVEPPPVPDEEPITSAPYDPAQYDTPDGEPTTGEFAFGDPHEEQTSNTGLPIQKQESTNRLGIPLTTVPSAPPLADFNSDAPGLGDDEHEAPTRVAPRLDASMLRPLPRHEEEMPTTTTPIPEPEPEPELEPMGVEPAEEAVEAPPEDEPAGEECDEATFFVEQGLYEEAREILETVLIAYPDHRRAAQLMARVEAEEAQGSVPAASEDAAEASTGESRDAFDLAQELANELGGFGGKEAGGDRGATTAGGDEYQVSVEEVFAEFKKGLEKVVKPEDVDTHYDLGVAYKEMGLIDDAVGEFSIARKGCLGKRKEIDCLSMIGMLQVHRGDFTAAIDAYQQGLMSEHAKGDVEKSLRYELAAAYEGSNQAGRALGQFLKVQALDGHYREVASNVERLSAIAVPEDDAPPPPKAAPPRPGGGRKVGYV